jgi:isopentenyldiphosphate isomerase
MSPVAQDPHELFDLVDATGAPLGRTKPRAAVHRDGDWHRAIHVWVIHTAPPIARVILQRRSLAKDTWPGRVDVSVGGHLGAGETPADALREAREEIGLTLTPADVHLLGRSALARTLPGGVRDREILDVFVARVDAPLKTLMPNPAEVAELLSVSLDDALALWSGERASAPVTALSPDGSVRAVLLSADDLCGPDGGFRRRALSAVLAWTVQGSVTPWPLAPAIDLP